MHVPLQERSLPSLSLPDGVTVWDSDALDDARRRRSPDCDGVMRTINALGERSRQAQSLHAVLTSVARLHENRRARLYLLCRDGRGVGILKVGVKKLFITHPSYASLVEIDPLCVLDFFIDVHYQRCGLGRLLFDHMLQHERLTAGEVAIDRPSVKFLAFLRKHYGLVEYTPQSNNFVVFHRYFDQWQPQRRRHVSGEPAPSCPPNGAKGEAVGANTAARAKKTAYELQYEEYVRQQIGRAGERDATFRPCTQLAPSARVIAANSCGGVRRRPSPTRSGVPYNIISGALER